MPDSAPVHVTTRNGRVRVVATDGAALSVEGGTIEHHEDGTMHVRRAPSSRALEVQCATGTDVTVGTVSGSVELVGALGAVRVSTVSGKIRIETAASVDARTKSGKVDIGSCAGECRVMTTSATVHVGRAGRASVAAISGVVLLEKVGGAQVKTVSGKVLLATEGGGQVTVHTVSGKVDIRVPRAHNPATRLRSVSGRVRCDCEPGSDGEIAVSSVSGAINVSSR